MKKSYIILLGILITYSFSYIHTASTPASNKAKWDTASFGKKVLTSHTDNIIKDIKSNVGAAAAQVASIVKYGVSGNVSKFVQGQSGNFQNTDFERTGISTITTNYYDSAMLTTNWLTYFTQWINSAGRTVPFANMIQASYQNTLQLSMLEENYITTHLAAAMKTFQNSSTVSTKNADAYIAPNSSWNAQNYVVINKIYNNTELEFYVFQKNKPIGILYPGLNAVALYCATFSGSDSSEDIVCIPKKNFSDDGNDNGMYGAWRITFKKSLSENSDDLNDNNNFSLGGSAKSYICTEIITKDVPKGGIATYQRAQCLNVSELKSMACMELNIEDHMSDISNNKEKVYDFESLKMVYPSIRSITPINYVTIPYFLTDDTVNHDIHELHDSKLTDANVNIGFDSGLISLQVTSKNLSILNKALQSNGTIMISVKTFPFKNNYAAVLEAKFGSKILFTQSYDNVGAASSAVLTSNNFTYTISNGNSKNIDMKTNDFIVLKATGYKALAPSNAKVKSWLNMLNILLIAIEHNYGTYADPNYIMNSIVSASPLYIIQSNSQGGDITSPTSIQIDGKNCVNMSYNNSQIQVVVSQITSATTLPTSDIPTSDRFNIAMKLYTKKQDQNKRYIDMDSVHCTTASDLNFMEQTKFAELYGQYKILQPYSLKVKQVDTKGFTVIGSSGFAKNIVSELQQDSLIFITIQKLPGVYLEDDLGNEYHFTITDFLRNIGTQAAGMSIAYMKPNKTITISDQKNKKAQEFGEYLFNTYHFGVKQIGSKGYTLTGASGFAKEINQTFIKHPQATEFLHMLKGVTLEDSQGKKVHVSIDDFINNITSQANGKSIVYMKPLSQSTTVQVANVSGEKSKIVNKQSVAKKLA